jgi:hypothetical protein
MAILAERTQFRIRLPIFGDTRNFGRTNPSHNSLAEPIQLDWFNDDLAREAIWQNPNADRVEYGNKPHLAKHP